MRNVILVAPFPMETTLVFARALAGLAGVRLLGLFQEAPTGEPRGWFHDVALIRDALDPSEIERGARGLAARHGPLHRIVGVLEDMQVQLAVARSRLGLRGISPEVAHAFRDKGRMKELLHAHSIPCAAHATLHDVSEAWAFVDRVGFPIVLKPPAGAGCRATMRCSNPMELHRALLESKPSPAQPVLAEEFLHGAEHSFETVTIGGVPRFHSISRYYPSPLEVMESPWIQWAIVLPQDTTGPEYEDVRQVGHRTITALGLDTGMTHMEWFRRPNGTLAIGEIAARPPGAQIVKLMNYAHDADLHRAWARAMVDEAFDGPFPRKYSTGIAFLRGPGEGRVARVEGLEEAQRRMGALVVEARLPQVGAPRASGYEGEGFAIVRHPDTEVVKKAIWELITTVKVHYA